MKSFQDLLKLIPRLAEALDRHMDDLRSKSKEEFNAAVMDPNGKVKRIQNLTDEILDIPQTAHISDVKQANQTYAGWTVSQEKYDEIAQKVLDLS